MFLIRKEMEQERKLVFMEGLLCAGTGPRTLLLCII